MRTNQRAFENSKSFLAQIILSVVALILPITVLAAPPDSAYGPGETLDPSCSPGGTNCTVIQLSIATSTGNVGIGTSSPDARFTISATSSNSTLPLLNVYFTTGSATTTALSVSSLGVTSLTNLLLTGSTTLQNFTALTATTTSATSTNLFSTTASFTNLLLTNALSVAYGGTGVSTFSSGGFLFGNGTGALSASSSPTVGWLAATSTTATSTFAGGLQANALNITSTSATSTFALGINLAGGCFAINGVCVGGAGGGSGTVNAATAIGQVPYYAAASNAVTATSTLFISTASNVGIGTTTPEGKLEIAGNIFLSALSAGTRRFQVGTSTADADVTGSALEILAGGGASVSGNGFGGALRIRGGIGGGNTGSVGGALTVSGGSGYTGGAFTANGGDSNDGGAATFRAGDGSSDNGGVLTVRAGDGVGNGGNATIRSGDGNAGGTMTIRAGNGFSGGVVNINGGSGSGSGGGAVNITGGTESAGNGGSVTVKGGTGSAVGGTLTLSGGDSSGSNTNGGVEIKGGTGGDGGGGVTIHSSNAGLSSGPDVTIYAGNGASGYVGGDVVLYGGTGDTVGNILLADVAGTPRGLVGIGSSTPYAQLAVFAPTGTSSVLVGSSTGTYFSINPNGYVGIGKTSAAHLIELSGGAYSDGANWTDVSSRVLKENFTTLDSREVLEKINSLEISRWNYKTQTSDTTHIGPVAEDFYEAFQTGGESGKTSLASLDTAGVALLGIQALSSEVEALKNRSTSGLTFDNVISSLQSLGTNIKNGLAEFRDIVAETLTVKKLCVEDVCVTKTELRELLDKNGIGSASAVSGISGTEVATSTDVSIDTIPPTITLNGNNPATIDKGSSYADLGATVVDPAWGDQPANNNLGINVTGANIDTSIPGEYTVTYTATDQAGNTATSTRTVIVTDPNPISQEAPLVPEVTETSTGSEVSTTTNAQ